jgi:hypothetical protein
MKRKKILGPKLLMVLLPLLLSSFCTANDFYAGNQYIWSTEYNENYVYKWSASFGSYQENDKNIFAWTAPYVNSPTEVAISVLVTDKRCGCYSNFDEMIIVIPHEEPILDIKALSNSTDPIQINDSTGLMLIPRNNTGNSTATVSMLTDTKLDPASESPENFMKPLDQTFDALSVDGSQSLNLAQNDTGAESAIILSENDSNQIIASVSQEDATLTDLISGTNSAMNAENDSANIAIRGETLSAANANLSPATEEPSEEATDKNNQAATAENPLAAKAQNDQSPAEETCTLSFGDGVEVDVVFEQGNSLANTAYVIIQDTVKEVIGSGSSSDDINTPASLTNMTSVPEPGIDQSGANINQTNAANALSEIMAGSTGKTDETPEQLNSLDTGSEAAAASPDPNENPFEQAINQTDIGLN